MSKTSSLVGGQNGGMSAAIGTREILNQKLGKNKKDFRFRWEDGVSEDFLCRFEFRSLASVPNLLLYETEGGVRHLRRSYRKLVGFCTVCDFQSVAQVENPTSFPVGDVAQSRTL